MKILIIEDDSNISYALKQFFIKQEHEVECCFSLAEAYQNHPERQDFILLDLNLPDGDGFEYLTYVRSKEIHTPILLLTVRDQEQDIVRGLKIGADDYLTKPFSLPVLKARMDNILRRMNFDKNSCEFKCGNIRLDKKAKMVFIGEQPLELSAKEYELLELLMENKGLTLPRERILDILWGWEQDSVYDNTLTVTIKRLREKIVPYQNYIRTVRGIGYRLTEGEE